MLFERKKSKKEAKKVVRKIEGNQLQFEKLTLIDDAQIGIYEKAIHFAFENEDIRNVAMSGAYGSGKSSVLASYKKLHPDKKFIHISLAHFCPEKRADVSRLSTEKIAQSKSDTGVNTLNQIIYQSETDNAQEEITEPVLEGKILNQLLHQIPPERIPQTSFNVKNTVGWKQILIDTARCTILLLCMMHMVFSYQWIAFVQTFPEGFLRNVLTYSTEPGAFLISGIAVFLIVAYRIFEVARSQKYRSVLKRLKILENEIEIFEDSEKKEESLFDKYLNEVMYLFENAEADVIVFEDIDRFGMEEIFERLREINTLVNIRLKQRSKSQNEDKADTQQEKQRILRFFYLLSDDLFNSKDRTKFFDYIIPIIPVIDTSNSFDQLLEHLKRNQLQNAFQEHFLKGLSLYIDDMRILKNICNEFLIYYTQLKNIQPDSNKMLAIIAYKNLFPRDFNSLQYNQGFIYHVFANKEKFIQRKAKQIEKELGNKRNEREQCWQEYEQQKENLKKSQRLQNGQTIGNSIAELRKRLWMLDKEIAELENKLAAVDYSRLCEVIPDDFVSELETEQVDHGIRLNKKDVQKMVDSEYFGLVRYLLFDGFIDETYPDYMTYFYPNNISPSDKIFLRSVLDRSHKPYSYKLREPEIVFNMLKPSDFKQKETLNFELLTYLLVMQPESEQLSSLFGQLKGTKNYAFVEQYLGCTTARGTFVYYLNQHWATFFSEVVQQEKMSPEQIRRYSIDTLYYSPIDSLPQIDADRSLVRYISSAADYLDIEDPTVDKLIQGLARLKVKFSSINYEKSNAELFLQVYSNHLYELNFENISMMLAHIYFETDEKAVRHKNFTLIMSKPESALSQYVGENISKYMDVMLENCDASIQDDEMAVRYLLNNSKVTTAQKETYISYCTRKIDSLQSILDATFWPQLLERDLVKFSGENVWSYFEKNNLDDHLVHFINRGGSTLNLKTSSKKRDAKKIEEFFKACLTCTHMNTDRYIDILTTLEYDYPITLDIENIPKDKMEGLIEKEIIDVSLESLAFIREKYPDMRKAYIGKNVAEYVKLIHKRERLFDRNEMLDILSSSAADELKIELLKVSKEPVSVIGREYSARVRTYILLNKLDLRDLPQLYVQYSKEADKVRKLILDHAVNSIESIINDKIPLDDQLICDLLGLRNGFNASLDKDEDTRIGLLGNVMPVAPRKKGNSQQRIKLLRYLDSLGNLGTLEGTNFGYQLRQRNKRCDITPQNQRILDMLLEKGWIDRYEVDPMDEASYKFYTSPQRQRGELTTV